ncbi:MAG: helix-turn-helix domain-containing protein [Prevotella sp.]|nr:helix-turn-helix domain-containing protein [Prevotella sp.]
MNRLLILISVCFHMISAWSQIELKYRDLNTEDGLPSNSIINIVQDPQGYIWMATSDGLCRYDGYSSDVLRHTDSGNNALLLSNRLRWLYQNPNGLLFIRLQGERYSCYDTNLRRFVHFIPNGNDQKNYCDCVFTPDGDTWLWYTYSGCLEVKYHNGKITSHEYNEENGLLASNDVRFILPDSHHKVWIGTSKGLYLKEKGSSSLRTIDSRHAYLWAAELGQNVYFATTDNQIVHVDGNARLHTDITAFPAWTAGNAIRGLAAVNDDRLLVITNTTTYSYSAKTGKVDINDIQMPEGTVYQDNAGNCYVGDNNVNVYYIDKTRHEIYTFNVLSRQLLRKRGILPYMVGTGQDGKIWITTTGNGLFVYDPTTRQQLHYTPRTGQSPIKSDYLYGLLIDRSGNIWVSQENMGLSVITAMPAGVRRCYAAPSASPDYVNLFRSVRQTSDQRVWAGNLMGGTYMLHDAKTLQPTSIGTDDDMLSVCVDKKGHTWIGTRNKGVSVDGKFYTHNPDDPTSLPQGKVFDLLCDNDQRMWVAVNMGALCLAVPQPDGTYKFRKFLKEKPLMKNVTKLLQTRSGIIFVGCGDGVVAFDPEQLIDDSENYYYYNSDNSELGYFEIRDIFEDSEGTVWLASAGGGIYRVSDGGSLEKLRFRQYDTRHGLADNTANAIVADANGMMWIGTNHGLSKLNPKTMSFTTYFLSADKLGDVYSENSACRMADGTLVLGTNNGIVCFNPLTTQLSSSEGRHLVVTNLLVNGTMFSEYESEKDIRLSHHQNSLTFRFSDMKFDFPHNTEYIYILVGVDKTWSQPTRQNEAVYKDLAPGTYVFHVRIVGDDTGKEATMRVVIRQPWWNTWWAWLIYIAVVGGIAWYIIRLLLITYSMRNRIRMDKEISDFKQKLFMDLSHEFRTPLTLIQGSMDRMRRAGELPASLRQPMSNMRRSTERMMRLVNQLLEMHKLQSGKLSLKLQETDVIRFLREITMTFSDLAQNREMNLLFVPFAQHYTMYVDRGCLDKIVYNLLSNAFKYTPRKGDVTVRVRMDEGKLIIRVEDTGVGVPKDRQSQLFTRFMQASNAANSSGIGLNFTEQLTLAHHGEIAFEENPAGGSIFTVKIPESPECYLPDEFMEESALDHMTDDAHDDDRQWRNYRELVSQPLNDRRVLIVDDDEDVRDYIRCELSPYFTVEVAQDGVEALERIHQSPTIDLIVSDIKMPQMDGIELLKKVRADDGVFDIPFVLLTALGSIEKQLQGARFGADAYLPKPFNVALLVSKCISLIEQRDRLRKAYAMPAEEGGKVEQDADATPLLTSERDRRFREIVDLKISNNLSNPDFVVEDLAQATGYGRSQFYSKMMEVTGKTPKEYIRQRRMARAAELLRSGEMITVAEVAYQVGFSDSLYFSRCFKQHFGVTPSKYQKGS